MSRQDTRNDSVKEGIGCKGKTQKSTVFLNSRSKQFEIEVKKKTSFITVSKKYIKYLGQLFF